MSNLANGRTILKFNNSAFGKSFSSLYSNFILNLYIVYELNDWPPISIISTKKCSFSTAVLVRNAVKCKCTYNGWGMAFHGEGPWSFGNDFAGNVVLFSVDNSSSSYTDNWKITF